MAGPIWVTVLRGFPASGGLRLSAGDIVDAADWHTREALIRQRYIRLATPEEVAATEEAEVDVPAPPRAKVRPAKARR